MRIAGHNRSILFWVALPLLFVLASCGVEEGYESLEVRYEGVPINLDAAAEMAESTQPEAAVSLSDDAAQPSTTEVTGDTPDELAYVDSADVPSAVTDIDNDNDDEGVEQDHQAHRDPEVAVEGPGGAAETVDPAQDVESAESDLRNVRRRALRSFRGLVANATTLRSGSVDCLVEYVDASGVNPVPMNRAIRRGLSGSTSRPSRRFVALAYDAAASCGVTLSESLLR